MTPTTLITTPIPEPGPSLLAASGTVTVLPGPPDRADLRRLCASGDFDAVLTQLRDVVDADLLAAAQVRGVSNFAVGHHNIDVRAATRHGILVGNTPGVLTDATADVATALMLATSRRVVEGDRLVREGRFTGWEPELLLGRDVYEDEPRLAPGLADLPNTVLLPHVGSATVPVRREMSRLSALNAIAMAEGRMPPHTVNPEAMG